VRVGETVVHWCARVWGRTSDGSEIWL